MKKIFTLCVAVLVATVSISAKEYKHSVGMVAGLGIGAQYKAMVMDNFTIIAEYGYSINPDGGKGFGYQGVTANGVAAYQGHITEGQGIKLDWFAGGQLKLGYAMGDAGIFGTGAAGGIELNMTNAPIAISFDFRPGYGLLFGSNGGNVVYDPAIDDFVVVPGGTFTQHMFDYSFNLGVRYTF